MNAWNCRDDGSIYSFNNFSNFKVRGIVQNLMVTLNSPSKNSTLSPT